MMSKTDDDDSNNFNEKYIQRDRCLEHLQLIRSRQKVVLGIEGFYLSDSGLRRPNMNEIADFSSLASNKSAGSIDTVELSYNAGVRFMQKMLESGESDVYNFVVAS